MPDFNGTFTIMVIDIKKRIKPLPCPCLADTDGVIRDLLIPIQDLPYLIMPQEFFLYEINEVGTFLRYPDFYTESSMTWVDLLNYTERNFLAVPQIFQPYADYDQMLYRNPNQEYLYNFGG